jgi:hypothetical protein
MALSGSAQQTILASQSTTPITLTLASLSGYSSTVIFRCLKMLNYVGSCTFSPGSLTVPANGSASTTFVVNTTAGVAFFNQTLLLVADDGVVAKHQPFSLYIPVFSITVQAVTPGLSPGTAVFNYGAAGIAPFGYSCSGLPAGATCSFPGGSSGTLTVNIPSGIAGGSYPFTVNLSSNGLTTSTSAVLVVNSSFLVDAPTVGNGWVPPAASTIRQVTIESVNGSQGAVTISCQGNWGGSCQSTAVNVPAGGSVSAQLTIAVPAGTATGSYSLTVQAAANSTTQTFNFSLVVADYSGTLSSSNLTMSAGASGNLTATIAGTSGINGSITIACQAPGGITCVASPASISLASPTLSATSNISISAAATAELYGSMPIWACALAVPFFLRKRYRVRRPLLLIAICAVWLLGCGGGGGGNANNSSPARSNSSYTVTITAAASGTTTTRTLGTVNVTVTH